MALLHSHDYLGSEDEGIGLDDVTALTTGKIGTKKMRRLQAKADKKALREVRYNIPYFLRCLLYSLCIKARRSNAGRQKEA